MKNKTKYLFDKFRQNRIYLLVLLTFFLVFLYGKNIITSDENTKSTECIAVNDNDNAYIIDNQATYFLIKDLINSNKGDYYRLKFVAEVAPDIRRSVSNSNEKGKEYEYVSNDYPYVIETSIKSKTGEEKQVGETSITSHEKKFYEYVFRSDDNYSDVIFRKQNINDLEKVFISNVSISRLNINNDDDLKKLIPTKQSIVTSGIIPELPDEGPKRYLSLSGANQQAGEMFVAKEEYLDGVYLYIDTIGNGGVGDYTLGLYTVSDRDEIAILAEPFRSFRFQVMDLEKYRLRGDLYKIPFSFPLEKEKKYYLSLSNRSAVTNRSNNVRLGIWESKDREVLSYHGDEKNHNENSSVLFPVFLSSQYYNEEKLTKNSLIEDLGGGEGRFYYTSLSGPSDLLVPEYNLYAGYDQLMKAVIFWGEKNYSLDYVFNTLHPIKKFSFNLKQAMGAYPQITVKYSLDRVNWFEVESQRSVAAPYLFSQSVEVPLQQEASKIYISIFPKDNPGDFANKYLAIYDFELGADLDMRSK